MSEHSGFEGCAVAGCSRLSIVALVLLALSACPSKSEKPGSGVGDAAPRNLLEQYFPEELNGYRPRTVRSENGVGAFALYGNAFGGKKVAIGAGILEQGGEGVWSVRSLLKGLLPGSVHVSSDGQSTTTGVVVQGYPAELLAGLYDCGPTSFDGPLEPERCSQRSDLVVLLGDRIFVTVYVWRAERPDEALEYARLLDLAAMDAIGNALPENGQEKSPATIDPKGD